jgi:hypothetical protein
LKQSSGYSNGPIATALRAALIESYDWTRHRFVIGGCRSWDTIKESLDIRDRDTKTGVAIGQWDGEARFVLKGKGQGDLNERKVKKIAVGCRMVNRFLHTGV